MPDEDTNQVTADDVLEDSRQDPDQSAVGNMPLPEDNDRPAAPADDVPEPNVPTDHQETDANIDSHEAYDTGEANVAASPGAPNQQQGEDDEPEKII